MSGGEGGGRSDPPDAGGVEAPVVLQQGREAAPPPDAAVGDGSGAPATGTAAEVAVAPVAAPSPASPPDTRVALVYGSTDDRATDALASLAGEFVAAIRASGMQVRLVRLDASTAGEPEALERQLAGLSTDLVVLLEALRPVCSTGGASVALRITVSTESRTSLFAKSLPHTDSDPQTTFKTSEAADAFESALRRGFAGIATRVNGSPVGATGENPHLVAVLQGLQAGASQPGRDREPR
jgi:hypothetical protein